MFEVKIDALLAPVADTCRINRSVLSTPWHQVLNRHCALKGDSMRGMFASIWVLSYGLTLLLSTAIASAQQNRVQATVDPAVLIITGEQSVVSGRLDINARGTDVRRI